MTIPNAHEIADRLTVAQKRCLAALTPEWQETGYSKAEADILWAMDAAVIRSGFGRLVDCRYDQSPGVSPNYQHRLLKLGVEVRQYLIDRRDPGGMVLIEVERNTEREVLICTGCGTVETVRSIRARSATAFTCCPERKMVRVADYGQILIDRARKEKGE